MTATRTARRATPARTAPSPTAAGGGAAVLRLVVVGLLVVGGASVSWAQDGVREAAVAAAAALELAPNPQDQQDPEAHAEDEEHDDSRITDEYIPLALDGFPQRPKPLIELGQPFLGTGNIGSGFTIPGGAVWTPSFVAFGTYRGGLSVIDDGAVRTTQWTNRLDFFGNLALTGSERFVFGFRPLDETVDGQRLFSGYSASTPGERGVVDQLNFDWNTVSHLFFEGELGELFPGLDDDDRRGLDFGFSVGRQPISFESPDIKVGRSQRTGSTCAVSPAHLSSSNNHRLNTLRRLLAAAEQAPQPERGLRRRPSTEARKYCSGRSQKNP